MKAAVLQSNYIPWKGYFDIIHDVELFVFYDDVQFTKNDWRNRNLIVTAQGPRWLSIPVGQSLSRLVCEVRLADPSFQRKHFETLRANYARAPYFAQYKPFLEHVYLERTWETLSELNHYLITRIASDFLGCKTRFADSRDYPTHGARQERLLSLLTAVGAERYVSGPAAKDYIVEKDFADAGVALIWKDYAGYPAYPQQYGGPFAHGVSILDLLFNTGDDAPYYIWGWRECPRQNSAL